MTAETLYLSLQLSMPEIILAVGALALLMIGVFSGDKSAPTVTGLAVALLAVAGLWLIFMPGEGRGLWRRLQAGCLRPLHEGAGAHRFDHRHGHVRRPCEVGSAQPLRVPGASGALDARHAALDLGERSDRVLSRPRTDVAGALRHRCLQPGQPALDRSRPQIFRPRRALFRHDALRHVAGLRLHRQYRL
jgi:hypothetical protein